MTIGLSQDSRLGMTILETIGALVCVMDTQGRIVLFNKAAQQLTGYSEQEVLGAYPWDLFILPEEKDDVQTVFNSLSIGNFPNKYINYWLTKEGRKRQISWSNTALADEQNNLTFIIATGIDITEQQAAEAKILDHQKELKKLIGIRTRELNEANKKLEMLAYHDDLTGLANRRYLNKILNEEIRRTRRTRGPLSILIADIDFFKNYNDTYGHPTGDRCLIEIADLFKQNFQRASDLIARMGGEEFCVVLPMMDARAAQKLAQSFLHLVREHNIQHKSSKIADHVTLSIGVASYSEQNSDLQKLIKAADQALYDAKDKGRNRVEVTHTEFVT